MFKKLALVAAVMAATTAMAGTDKEKSASVNQPSTSASANQPAASTNQPAPSASANQPATSASANQPSAMSSSATNGSSAQGDESVKQLQQALKDKGFDPGKVDGIMGPKTQAAIDKAKAANADIAGLNTSSSPSSASANQPAPSAAAEQPAASASMNQPAPSASTNQPAPSASTTPSASSSTNQPSSTESTNQTKQ